MNADTFEKIQKILRNKDANLKEILMVLCADPDIDIGGEISFNKYNKGTMYLTFRDKGELKFLNSIAHFVN